MIILLPTLIIAGLIAYYFIIFKPKHDDKKIKRKGRQDMADDPFDCTEITEYPTYQRNKHE